MTPVPPPSMPGPGERRAQPRLACSMAFPVTLMSRSGSLADPCDFTAIDISGGGIRLRTRGELVPGDTAFVRMTSRSSGAGIVAIRVMHSTRDDRGESTVGARFTPLTPEMVRALLVAGDGESGEARSHRAIA